MLWIPLLLVVVLLISIGRIYWERVIVGTILTIFLSLLFSFLVDISASYHWEEDWDVPVSGSVKKCKTRDGRYLYYEFKYKTGGGLMDGVSCNPYGMSKITYTKDEPKFVHFKRVFDDSAWQNWTMPRLFTHDGFVEFRIPEGSLIEN